MPKARREKAYYSYVDEWKTLWKADVDALGGYNGQSCDPTRVDPKVIQWLKDNCALMPHFVKVMTEITALGRSTKNASGSLVRRRIVLMNVEICLKFLTDWLPVGVSRVYRFLSRNSTSGSSTG